MDEQKQKNSEMSTHIENGRAPADKVRLKITGLHQSDKEQEKIETDTNAQYFCREEAHYIFYEEKEEAGGSIRTRLKYKNGVLEIQKKGLTETLLVFEDGKIFSAFYPTPMGSLPLKLQTRKLAFEETKERLKIEVDYDMELSDYEKKCQIQILVCKNKSL